jgi:hypothetical protein
MRLSHCPKREEVGKSNVWFWPPSVSNNHAFARRWRTSPNYRPFFPESFFEERRFYIFSPNLSIIKYGWYHPDVFRLFRTREV